MKIFSVYDKKARIYDRPFSVPSDAHAARSFQQEVNRADENNMLYQYPDDYTLYHIGDFDTEVGKITPQYNLILEGSAAKRVSN